MNRPERTGEYKRIDFLQFDIYSRRKMVWSRLHPQLSLVVPAYPSQQSREWIRTGAATEHSYTNATTNAIYNNHPLLYVYLPPM